MNPTQLDIVDRFRAAVLEATTKAYPVRYHAICITTPFTGFAGEKFEFYVTEKGEITDGGSTFSLFRSLRCCQDYRDWLFREDYLTAHGIIATHGRLVCANTTPSGILRYAQGVAELQTKFQAHPLGEEEGAKP